MAQFLSILPCKPLDQEIYLGLFFGEVTKHPHEKILPDDGGRLQGNGEGVPTGYGMAGDGIPIMEDSVV